MAPTARNRWEPNASWAHRVRVIPPRLDLAKPVEGVGTAVLRDARRLNRAAETREQARRGVRRCRHGAFVDDICHPPPKSGSIARSQPETQNQPASEWTDARRRGNGRWDCKPGRVCNSADGVPLPISPVDAGTDGEGDCQGGSASPKPPHREVRRVLQAYHIDRLG